MVRSLPVSRFQPWRLIFALAVLPCLLGVELSRGSKTVTPDTEHYSAHSIALNTSFAASKWHRPNLPLDSHQHFEQALFYPGALSALPAFQQIEVCDVVPPFILAAWQTAEAIRAPPFEA